MSDKVESYLGNVHVKRDGVQQEFTIEQIKEYKKCQNDAAYFTRTYCKVISLDKGLVPFELYPYQEEMFEHFNDNRFSIVLACRQSGKSISSCAYLLWYALFHPEKTIAILANRAATAKEMVGRITLMLENIPFFLQPGCKSLNKQSISFSNNSRIHSDSTSGSSIRGMSINLLYLDEFAFVQDAGTFYTSTYPVISSGKNTKVIITSTANGIGNVFHTIWSGATKGTSEYKPFTVDWWDVPGRDDEWKRQTIANTSQLQFEQEFGNSFLGTGTTLVNGNTLLEMKADTPIYTQNNLRIYKTAEKNRRYFMFVDVAKGRGMDYSTFNVIDVTQSPFEQVAVYQDNMISPLLFPDIIYKYAKVYNNADVFIENNDAGAVVCNGLYYDLEYENMYLDSSIKANGLGVNMNKKVKRIGCSHIKDLLEENKIIINDGPTIQELSVFESRGNSWEAADGYHDDLVMNLVLFGWFSGTPMFKNMLDMNIKSMMYEESMQMIENDLVPFGIHDNGLDDGGEYISGDRWYTVD